MRSADSCLTAVGKEMEVNIRRKNRRYLAAGLTVFSLLFGGLQVLSCREAGCWMGNKDTERRKSNMEILIASEQPYTYLSQMKERIQFVGQFSPGELYQLQEILPYLMIKEHIGKEELRGIPKCIWKWLRNGRDGRNHQSVRKKSKVSGSTYKNASGKRAILCD